MHYPTWSEFKDVDIVAVCDLDAEKLAKKAAEYGIPNQFLDAKNMMDSIELDALVVVLPPKPVFEISEYAFKKGIRVFTEKTPGMMPEETRKLVYAAEENNCHSQAGLNRRFTPVVREAKKRVLSRGTPASCSASYNKFEFTPPGRESGDYLIVDGIHAIDTLFYLADSLPKRIHPYSHRANTGYLSRYSVMVEFQNGCVGTYMGNYNSGVRHESFEIHGDGISFYINSPDKSNIFVENSVFVHPVGEVVTDVELTGSADRRISYGYVDEMRHFVDVILKKREPEVTLRDTIPVMDLLDAVRKAE
jgi:predicted dehydrogenase